MRKAILILAAIALFTSMAQAQDEAKFLLTEYQRIDLREDSDRYPETDFVEGRSLLFIKDHEVTISGTASFDLIKIGHWEVVDEEAPEDCKSSTSFRIEVIDVADGEEGILKLQRFIHDTEGIFWGVYLFWVDTEMYYQFLGEAIKK